VADFSDEEHVDGAHSTLEDAFEGGSLLSKSPALAMASDTACINEITCSSGGRVLTLSASAEGVTHSFIVRAQHIPIAGAK
jgi:hypothetical protein